MALQTFSRFEKKYLLTENQKNQLVPYLLDYLELDPNNKENSFYSIYNIYYDTLDNHLIAESIKKPVYKEKLRLRSYNFPVKDDDMVFLEIKKKSEGKVNKRRIIITYKEACDLINKGLDPLFDEKNYLNQQVLKEIKYILKTYKLVPNYFIAYDRIAFFAKDDPSIRITFDKNIRQRTKDVTFTNQEGTNILKDNMWLMEIKVGNSLPLWLTRKLSELQIYPTSFSKYGKAYQNNIKGAYNHDQYVQR